MNGCLTAVGAAAALMLSTGAEAQPGPELPCPVYMPNSDYTDYPETNYSAECTATVGTSLVTFGSHGLCLASIYNALYCASSFFSTHPTNNYTIIMGLGSTPLSVDLSRDFSQVCVEDSTTCTT